MSLRKHHSDMINSLKLMGRVDQWSRYMTGGGYTDAIQIDNYNVEIQEDERDIRMFLWSRKRPCVTMVLDKHDTIGVIDTVEYNPECTIDGRMKRGEGTRDMIKFAIKLLKNSGATKVQLVDKSSIICEGEKVRLGLMYFFKYGQTLYERYFGFHPEAKYVERYARAKEIQRTLQLDSKPCNYFTSDVLDEILAETKLVFLYNIVWEKDLTSGSLS